VAEGRMRGYKPSPRLPKTHQLLQQPFGLRLQRQNIPCHLFQRPEWLVLVEILVEADFITDLGLIQVDPGFSHMRPHFPEEVVVDVFL